MRPSSLYPIPGSKRSSKYNCLHPNDLGGIVEPFMGGAGRSLKYSDRPILGEINPAHRQIATAHLRASGADYISNYLDACSLFLIGVDVDALLKYRGQKQSQKLLKQHSPKEYEILTHRWQMLTKACFERVRLGDDIAGLYSFLQRSCFGNVMRLNPKGTGYNVSWHIEKLANAITFDPSAWIDSMIGWKPKVFPSWQEAIAAANRKHYLLLDPPYWVDGKENKCTPCYPGHSIGTKGNHDETYALAVDPLIEGMRKGFPLIHLCNYWSDRLERDVVRIAFANGYSIAEVYRGQCAALGNSNGRLDHENRVDHRPKPAEVIWEFRPAQQLRLL